MLCMLYNPKGILIQNNWKKLLDVYNNEPFKINGKFTFLEPDF